MRPQRQTAKKESRGHGKEDAATTDTDLPLEIAAGEARSSQDRDGVGHSQSMPSYAAEDSLPHLNVSGHSPTDAFHQR
eukprot:3647486-Amphidinium_carterae.1